MASENNKKIFAKNLLFQLEKKKMTQTELAKLLNYPATTISNWINATNYPRIDKIQELADFFMIPKSFLTEEVQEQASINLFHSYPFLPFSVGAGLSEWVDSYSEYEAEMTPIPDSFLGTYAGNSNVYLMNVNGESMNLVMPDSSTIAVTTNIDITNLKPGDIVVYRHRGDGISVKRYYDLGDEVLFKADSSDSAFKGKEYRFSKCDEDLEILGKVIMVSYRL